jgi:hypothetical protein
VLKYCLLPFLALIALSGCHTNPACERQIGLMRSELIALEDKYYALEARYREEVGHDPQFESCEPISSPIIESGTPRTTPPSQPSDSDIRIQIDPNDSSGLPPPSQPSARSIQPSNDLSVVTFQAPRRLAANQEASTIVVSPESSSQDYVDAPVEPSAESAETQPSAVPAWNPNR